MGQMASRLTERQQRALPSNSKVKPRQEGNEHVKAVTLRSGKELVVPGSFPILGFVRCRNVELTTLNIALLGRQPKHCEIFLFP